MPADKGPHALQLNIASVSVLQTDRAFMGLPTLCRRHRFRSALATAFFASACTYVWTWPVSHICSHRPKCCAACVQSKCSSNGRHLADDVAVQTLHNLPGREVRPRLISLSKSTTCTCQWRPSISLIHLSSEHQRQPHQAAMPIAVCKRTSGVVAMT
jgi:hypothetical protein